MKPVLPEAPKKIGIALCVTLCMMNYAFSQNVVPNGSFEQFSSCPTAISQFETNVIGWLNPSSGGGNGTPDYFHSCANSTVGVPDNSRGYQLAHTGDAYCGIVISRGNYNQNFREYIEVPFTSTLETDSCYHFEMFFNLANISQFNSDNIQVYFSSTVVSGINNPYPLPFIPQLSNPAGNFPDSANWSVVSGDYIANGTENYMIIGNFFDSTNSNTIPFNNAAGSNVAFVFIDDVSLVKVPCALSAQFNAADNTICPGTCTDFINLSAGASSYLWNFPGGNPSVSTDVSPSGICYSAPGSYNVTLIISNGASSDTLTLNNFITVYPFPPPQGILQNGDTLFANPNAVSYQWFLNGNAIAGATDYYYVATQSGNYNVVATDENDCEVEAVINNVIANTSPLSFGEGAEVRLFPNPVSETLSVIGYTLSGTAAGEISIYNLLGEPLALSVNCCPWTIDCRPLPKGLYYIQITKQEKRIGSRFIKE